MDSVTDDRVLNNIWLGLHSFENWNVPECGPIMDAIEEYIRETFDDQTKICWYRCAIGRVSSRWSAANYQL